MARKQRAKKDYRFKINAYSPETMPLGLLTDYLADLAIVLGEGVHLVGIEDGSHTSLMHIDREAEPKVRERIRAVELEEAPIPVMEAYARINGRLRRDNADGAFLEKEKNLLFFPGCEPDNVPEYGPFNEVTTIDGVPVVIGGTREPVSVHLLNRNGERFLCSASREKAKLIAPHLFTTIIRAEGIGRWIRYPEGIWEARSFTIENFVPLADVSDVSLRASIDEIREIPAKWKELDDPIAELASIRYDTEM